jgi:hypothetical protein
LGRILSCYGGRCITQRLVCSIFRNGRTGEAAAAYLDCCAQASHIGCEYIGCVVRLAEWVPPVGGALSRHTSTWEVHATGAHCRRGRVVPRSKQPRRGRAAEEMRGPPSGRAQEGRRQRLDEVSGSRGRSRLSSYCLLELELTLSTNGVFAFYLVSALSSELLSALCSLLSILDRERVPQLPYANASLNQLAKKPRGSRVMSLPIVSGR